MRWIQSQVPRTPAEKLVFVSAVAGLIGLILIGRAACADDDTDTVRTTAATGGGALIVSGAALNAAADLPVQPVDGYIYSAERTRDQGRIKAGDTDVGSTTRTPSARGKEKRVVIKTEHPVRVNNADELLNIERAVQQEIPNTSRPAAPRRAPTSQTEAAARRIVEDIKRGVSSAPQDARNLVSQATSLCTSNPKKCKQVGKSLAAAGAIVVAGAALMPDPTDFLTMACDNPSVQCADGSKVCRGETCPE